MTTTGSPRAHVKYYQYVTPTGNILNDSDSGVDYLDHSVYAEALAEKIDRVTTPITIGIFARWGSGKSFLLKHVRNLLERRQRQNSIANKSQRKRSLLHWKLRCCIRFFVFFLFLSIIIVSATWVAAPSLFLSPLLVTKNDVTTPHQPILNVSFEIPMVIPSKGPLQHDADKSSSDFSSHFSRYIALGILLFALVVIGVVVCGNNEWWSTEFHKNVRLIFFVAFTKLPIKNFEKAIVREVDSSDVTMIQDSDVDMEVTSNKKYIFVNFNAWEYAGSDTLWAGIITTLSNAIEAEFGSVTTRLFRMLRVRAMPREERKEDLPKIKEPLLFARFYEPQKQPKDKEGLIFETMKQHGVVKKCMPYREWNRRSTSDVDDWWVTHFSSRKEAKGAFESMKGLGVDARLTDPFFASKLYVPPTSPNHTSSNLNRNDTVEPCDNEATSFIRRPSRPSNSDSSANSWSDQSSLPLDKDVSSSHNCCKHFLKHPKTICYLPNLFWHILAVFALIALPVITYMLAGMLHLDVYRTGRAVPIVVQIVSWMPAVGAASFVIIRFIWAMFHSQRSRINSALAGTRGNMATQLGFMNKVKIEVEYVKKLLQCAEYSHNKQYKVVISIDDLDRCALDKIKSVFEAVSILLSDNASPFVCLVAVDSRVAVKCIEDTMSSSLVKTNVNGYEYLKKIINLPFCLPEIDTKMKKQFIIGLVDLADDTKKVRSATSPASRRATVDARPPPRFRELTTSPMMSRSETSSSHGNHDDLDHLARNQSQRSLITKPDKKEHRLSMKGGDGMSLLYRPLTVPGPFKDEPDGAVTTSQEGDFRPDSDGGCRIPFIEENLSIERRDDTLLDDLALNRNEAAAHVRKNEAELPHSKVESSQPRPVSSLPDSLASQQEVRFNQNSHENSPSSPGDNEANHRKQTHCNPIQKIPLKTSAFLYKCRSFLYNNEMVLRHMEGNPRNIKRIFNVLSLTSWILHCYDRECRKTEFLHRNCQLHRGDDVEKCGVEHSVPKSLPVVMTDELAEDLVVWVILIDQWPYRMSYLMEVFEDLEQRPPSEESSMLTSDSSLLEVFEKVVRPEMDRIHSRDSDSNLLSMDIHPDMFDSFLKEIKSHGLLRTSPISLKKITINLDQSLRQTIVRQREGLLKRSMSKSSVSSAK